ncbi:MAG TPA: amidase family protein [Candidatus Nanoarchaeia archaeon]|nr:amidase family protein [Candidatus Nanoarchaeia archaeon]
MNSTKRFIEEVKKGNVDLDDFYSKLVGELKKTDKEFHYFSKLDEEHLSNQLKNFSSGGKLAGLPVSVKDCICVKGLETRASSRILTGYKPPFDATVVEKIRKEGGIVIGKTVQDEFGFGGFSVNVGLGFQVPLNPFDKKRSTGGSSGGSGGLTQAISVPHISLGESTGGSIVNPASFCGVVGLCPTYGRVSRYGLLDYGNSLDKIGPMSRNVEDAALMLEVISGYDEKESTSLNEKVPNYSDSVGKSVKGMKVGIIKEAFGEGVDDKVEKKVKDGVKKLESKGAKVEEVSLPISIKYGIPTYYLIATSEASTNLAKYCGMRYGMEEKLEGNFNQYFTAVRSKHFGKEAKRRIILGTFARMAGFREAYYMKAMKVRTKIIEEYKKAFKSFDALVCPTVPILPPKFEEIDKLTILQNYMIDVMTVGPNLAGLPHMNIPVGFEGKLPVGLMLIADHLKEEKLIQLGSALE